MRVSFETRPVWPTRTRRYRLSTGEEVEATEFVVDVAAGADDVTAWTDGTLTGFSNSGSLYVGHIPQ